MKTVWMVLIQSVCVFSFGAFSARASAIAIPTLYVIHIIPGDKANYTVSKEINDIAKITNVAISDFRTKHPTCRFSQDLTFKTGSENELFNKVNFVSKSPGRKIAVGFSRSSLARVAAKASQGSDLIGISIGASADDLKNLNSNFISMASPWSEQWREIKTKMQTLACKPDSTLVLGDVRDSYSFNFKKAAANAGFKSLLNSDFTESKEVFKSRLKHSDCVFLAMNMSTSHEFLSILMSEKWQGSIFGTGDWFFYSGELAELVQNSNFTAKTNIFVPTGWDQTANPKSIKMSNYLSKVLSHKVEPNGVYSYDAITIALGGLCLGTDPLSYNSEELKKLSLIKNYTGMSLGGNFLSPVRLVTFHGK